MSYDALKVGDVFTIEGVYEESWWRRLLRRCGLVSDPGPLRNFVVTHVDEQLYTYEPVAEARRDFYPNAF